MDVLRPLPKIGPAAQEGEAAGPDQYREDCGQYTFERDSARERAKLGYQPRVPQLGQIPCAQHDGVDRGKFTSELPWEVGTPLEDCTGEFSALARVTVVRVPVTLRDVGISGFGERFG